MLKIIDYVTSQAPIVVISLLALVVAILALWLAIMATTT